MNDVDSNINEALDSAIDELTDVIDDLITDEEGENKPTINSGMMGTSDMVDALTFGNYNEVTPDSADSMYRNWDKQEFIGEGGSEDEADKIDEFVDDCYFNQDDWGIDTTEEQNKVRAVIRQLEDLKI